MSAQVVPPIAEAHVGCGGSEIGLECQRAKGGIGVTGKANGISVAAETSPSVENKRSTVGAVVAHVVEENVIAPESLAQSFGIETGEVLLPVNPPEIDTLFLTLTDDMPEHGAVEGGVFEHPRHPVAADVHVCCYLSEMILVIGHAIGWVEVETHLQALIVHPVDESCGIGDKTLVPCPSCPSVEMPVHVVDHHIERDVVLPHLVDKIDEILLGVALIFAIPVAQHIKRWQRLTPCYLDVVADGFLVGMAIAHEIPVKGIGVEGFCQPVNAVYLTFEGEGGGSVASLGLRRLVNQSPTGP